MDTMWKRRGTAVTWFILGVILASNRIFRELAGGEDIVDAVYWFAYSSVSMMISIRIFEGWIVAGIVATVAIVVRDIRSKGRMDIFAGFGQWIRPICLFFLGWFSALAIIYILIDLFFAAGQIRATPFLIGAGMGLALMLLVLCDTHVAKTLEGMFRLLRSDRRTPTDPATGSFLTVFFCIALLLSGPNIIAMSGFAPDPPEPILYSFTQDAPLFDVETTSFKGEIPEEHVGWFTQNLEERNWMVHIHHPITVGTTSEGIALPVGVLLHGLGGYDPSVMLDTVQSIAGRGVIVILVEYPNNARPENIPNDRVITYQEGGSDAAEHIPRFDHVKANLDLAWAQLNDTSSELRNDVQNTIGENTTIDPSRLWIYGHSGGAGMLPWILTDLLEDGWGSEVLIIDMEASWLGSNADTHYGNLSAIPDHTMAHIVEYERDLSVHPCIGRFHQERISTRDGTAEPILTVLYLFVQTDEHGFPVIMTSHYTPASQLHEHSADLFLYPRLEAQAIHLFAHAEGENDRVNDSRAYLEGIDGRLTDLGKWSDGNTVKPILLRDDALNEGLPDGVDCIQYRAPHKE
ncbi:MAG: hypothetical protein DBX05_03000 [Candidatus Poseidoniales archaeon]|nr:MAG: hypothetical protein DBX05_03000 [Candidatus Poseidoniales archaeon]